MKEAEQSFPKDIPAADKLAKAERKRKPRTKTFPPLHEVTSPTVATEQAAYYINRQPQTLRVHACHGTGVLRPMRIGGRLAWPVADIKRVLGVA